MIDTQFQKQRDFFRTGTTLSIDYREKALRRLLKALRNNQSLLDEAIYSDFGKSAYENYSTELSTVYAEIKEALVNLSEWARPHKVKTNLANFAGKSYIHHDPFGVCLIIGAWNYPYQLTLGPLVPAIAAGNTVVLKPSELSPASSSALKKILSEVFPEEYLLVVEGDAQVTSAWLQQPFDKIFFTGSPRVGRIVMKAAAEHLASVTLELGGKSPCIVTADANLPMAARRIVWGKFLNAGQTCIAPDYVLVEKSVEGKLLNLMKRQIEAIYGPDPSVSEGYVRIINRHHFDRLMALVEPAKVFAGGSSDAGKLYIEPTLLCDVTFGDNVMQEEIFGPLLPVIAISRREDVFDLIEQHRNPLALYLFTSIRKFRREVVRRIPFGGGAVNDTVMHFANPNLPFGGVGNSGMGSYHGKFGFNCFSREKGVLHKALWFEPMMKYPPFTKLKKWLLKMAVE